MICRLPRGVLAASKQIATGKLDEWEFVGELSLNCDLRANRGCLPAVKCRGAWRGVSGSRDPEIRARLAKAR